MLQGEILDWSRFENRRGPGSYTGLCGGIRSNGATTLLLPFTKHGNVRLRTALIELAWRLTVWQPESKLMKKWWVVLGVPRATRAALID